MITGLVFPTTERGNDPADHANDEAYTEKVRSLADAAIAGSQKPDLNLADFYAHLPDHRYIFTPTRDLWPASSVNSRLPWPTGADGKKIRPTDILDTERSVEQMAWIPGAPMVLKDRLLDGGGVKPDVVLPAPAANALIKALDDQNILFDYVTEYCLRFDSIAGPEQFQFTEWDGFVKYLDQRKFTYKTASEEAIEKLKKEAEKENVSTTLQASIQAMESQLLAYRQQSLTENKKDIIRLIEEQIIGRYYFDKGRKQLGLRNDPEIMEAVKLLNDPVRYGNILSGK